MELLTKTCPEYFEIFYTESMFMDNYKDDIIEIPEVTKGMLRSALRDILIHFLSKDKNANFQEIINTKNFDPFIINSKKIFSLDISKVPNKEEGEDYKKFCLWGLLNVDKHVFDLLYISRRPYNEKNNIEIPKFLFENLKPLIKEYTISLLKEFEVSYPKYAKQCDQIINLIQQKKCCKRQ